MYGVVAVVSAVSIYLGILLFDVVTDLFGSGGFATVLAAAASDSILLISSVGGALVIAIIVMWDLS
jgi:hypothetical protein